MRPKYTKYFGHKILTHLDKWKAVVFTQIQMLYEESQLVSGKIFGHN